MACFHLAPAVRRRNPAPAVSGRRCRGRPRSAAPAGTSAAAAPTAGLGAAGARPAAHGHRGEQLHRVAMPLRAPGRCGGLGHGPGALEGRAACAAAVLIAWHARSLRHTGATGERRRGAARPGGTAVRRGADGLRRGRCGLPVRLGPVGLPVRHGDAGQPGTARPSRESASRRWPARPRSRTARRAAATRRRRRRHERRRGEHDDQAVVERRRRSGAGRTGSR